MRNQKLMARPIEVLSVTAANVRIKGVDKPVILITFRLDPFNSPASEIAAVTRDQAQRLREDIGSILDAGDNLEWR